MTPPLPRGDSFGRAEIERDFALATVHPVGLGHAVTALVPKDWKQFTDSPRTMPQAMDGASLDALWSTSESGAPSLQLFTARFDCEISAANWLRRFATAMDYELKHVEPVSSAIADSLITFTVDHVPMAGRLVIRLYGPHVVAALASTTAPDYGPQAELLGFLVRGTSAEALQPGGPMEIRQSVQAGAAVRFQLPQSWSATVTDGPDGHRGIVDMINTTPDGIPMGRIRLKWQWADQPIQDNAELGKFAQAFAAAGLEIGAMTHRQTSDESSEAGFSLVLNQIHRATIPGNPNPLEYRVIILNSPKVRVYLVSLQPDPAHYFTAWAVGRRITDIIVETLH